MPRSTRVIPLVLTCMLLLAASRAQAGNGRIQGWVRGADTRQPIAASVRIQGTGIGGTTDTSGRFVLLNVPPGSYSLKATAVGWAPATYRGITLHSDQILTLSLVLTPQDIELTELTVEAVRPAVDPAKTSGVTRFEAEDFSALPVHAASQVMRLSASAFGASIRGGAPHQSVTIVDGMDVTDRYDPQYGEMAKRSGLFPNNVYFSYPFISHAGPGSAHPSIADPPLSAIEQGALYVGAWGPEYGGVAGAVSYTLKDGRERWGGNAYLRVSQLGGQDHVGPDAYNDQDIYAAEKATRQASSTSSLQWQSTLMTWFPGKYSYGDDPEIEAGAGIGGPLGEMSSAYISATYFDTHGRLPGARFQQFNGTLKLTLSPWSATRLGFTGLLEDRGRLLGWKNRPYVDDYRYFLEGIPSTDGLAAVGGVKFTHSLSPTLFYELQVNGNYRSTRTGYCDDNGDGRISIGEDGDFLTWEDTAQVARYQAPRDLILEPWKFFSGKGVWISPTGHPGALWIAGPPVYYADVSTSALTAQLSLSALVGVHHSLTAGVRGTIYDITFISRQGVDRTGVAPSFGRSVVQQEWERRPRELSLYVQDRMEFTGIYLDVGLRVDVFDLRGSDYQNWYSPYQRGTLADGKPAFLQVRGEEVAPQAYLSPRLGVSHPVSQTMAVHFSFSVAHEPLPYSLLFAGYNTEGEYGPLVRLSQEPQRSTSYEIGLQWSPLEAFSIDMDVYQKDYLHSFANEWGTLPQVVVPGGTGPTLPEVVSSHGSLLCRGLELTAALRRIQPASFLGSTGRASYTYSSAMAGLEIGQNQTVFSAAAGDSARYGGTLPFASFDYWNKAFVHVPGGALGGYRGYDRRHRVTCSGILFLPADFTLSLTGRFASGFYYPLPVSFPGLVRWEEGPWNKQVDVRFEKGFPLGGNARFSLYVDLINAFNWANVVALREDPSLAATSTTAWVSDGDPTGGPTVNRPVTSFDGTLIYGPPREVYFGVRFDF